MSPPPPRLFNEFRLSPSASQYDKTLDDGFHIYMQRIRFSPCRLILDHRSYQTAEKNNNNNKLYLHDYNKYSIAKAFHS